MAGNDTNNWATEQTLRDILAKTPDPKAFAEALAKATGGDPKRILNSLGSDIDRLAGSVDKNTRAGVDLNRGLGNLLGGRMDRFDTELSAMGDEAVKTGGKFGKFGRLISMGAELAMMGFNRVAPLAEGVFDAYDTGVVFKGGLHEFNKAISDLAVDMATFQRIITRQSMVVQTLGTKRFVELGKSMQAATNYGTALGMKSDEVVQYMGDYAETMRITGSLEGMTNAQLVEGTKKYLTELNAVAQATGKRRDQIQAEVKQMQKRPDYLALVATFPKEVRENLQNAVKEFQKFGSMAPKMQDIVADILTRGSVAGIQDAAARTAIIQAGAQGDIEAYVDALKRGSTAEADAAAAAMRAKLEMFGENLAPQQARLSGLVGEAASWAAATVAEARDMEKRLREGGPIAGDSAEIIEVQTKVNRALEELNSQLNTAAIAMVQTFTPAVGKAADAAIALSDGFDEMLRQMGLINDKGGMTREGAQLAAAAAVSSIIGSAALFKLIARSIGPALAPTLQRLGVNVPQLGAGAAAGAAPGTSAVTRMFGGLLAGVSGISAAIENYQRSGSAIEAGTTGAGVTAGAYYGGQLGAKGGSFLGGKGEFLGGLAGGLAGGVLGQEGVEALFNMFDSEASTEMTPEQEQMATQLAKGVEDAKKRQEDQNSLLGDIFDQLRSLTDATNRQTDVLSGSIRRSGERIQ